MFDLSALHYNSENPTATSVLVTVLFAFLLSTLLVITYDKTTRAVPRPVNYLQTMILIAIVAATVMLAIGDSLARGLGMLGALAIIRFRTALRDPRNMAFMFGALAIGIACGVGGFIIATVGTVGVCVAAVILRFSPFSRASHLIGTVRFDVYSPDWDQPTLQRILRQHCRSQVMVRQQVSLGELQSTKLRYTYRVVLKQADGGFALVRALHQHEQLKKVNFELADTEVIL